VRLSDGAAVPVVSTGLERPHSLAVDAEGRIYVSDPAAHQVKVFRKDGTFSHAIGIKGGRPKPGRWVPEGMHNPTGVAVDPQGRLWVAERDWSPKRISLWTTQGGFIRDFIGPTNYGAGGGFADSQDKTRVFGNGCEWRMDYEANQAEIIANSFTSPENGELLRFGGREYFMGGRRQLYLRDGDAFRLIMTFGSARERTLEAVRDYHPHRSGKHNFIWTDLNSDGEIQENEVLFGDGPSWGTGYWGSIWLDEDFSINTVWGGLNGYESRHVVRIPRSGMTDQGVPVYDVTRARTVYDETQLPEGRIQRSGPSQLYLALRDRILFGTNPIQAVDPSGRTLWTYPNRWGHVHGSHHAPMPPDDATLIGMLACIGHADTGGPLGRIWAANSNMGRLYLMTTDGLMVASVFQDSRLAPEPWPEQAVPGTPLGAVTIGTEWFGGYFFRSEPTDEYYLLAGSTSYNLIRLDGFNTLQPLDGAALAFTVEHMAEAEAFQQRRAAEAARERVLAMARVEAGLPLDGRLDKYPAEAFVEWRSGPFRARGMVGLAGADLRLAWEVFGDSSPMVNAGEDIAQLFVTGDSVDLQLGTNPDAAADRTGPVEGDLRLLVSVRNGEPVAVLYRWKVEGATDPHIFRSPWRHATVDDVRVLDDARIHIARHGNRYIVEAAVPLATLGFAPQPGRDYRLDLGVIYSNAEGNDRIARMYWANPATGLTADIPGEIMATPNLWGTARMAKE